MEYWISDEAVRPQHQLVVGVGQQISVPFLWEEKPGTPKRDPQSYVEDDHLLLPIFASPPDKKGASVPFRWEESPGKLATHFTGLSSQTNNPFTRSVEEKQMLKTYLQTVVFKESSGSWDAEEGNGKRTEKGEVVVVHDDHLKIRRTMTLEELIMLSRNLNLEGKNARKEHIKHKSSLKLCRRILAMACMF